MIILSSDYSFCYIKKAISTKPLAFIFLYLLAPYHEDIFWAVSNASILEFDRKSDLREK
jgi:hypothetical protein